MLVTLLALAAGMGGLAFAAVPLYRVFCQVTGFGGTTQVAAEAPEGAAARTVTVRFNTDAAEALGVRFRPLQRKLEVRLGETALARFAAENVTDAPITTTATFNVTPYKTGPYFSKVECFCFEEQTLAPGERAEMPVTFFVEPAMSEDRNLDDITTITLSYTLFDARTDDDDAHVAAAHEPDDSARAHRERD